MDSKLFSVVDMQLCITLNNISHVRTHLLELSTLLNWELATAELSSFHDNSLVGKQAFTTLHNLMTSTNEEAIARIRSLAQLIIKEKISVDLKKYTTAFTQGPPCNNQMVR